MALRSYSFTVAEYDPERPWVLTRTERHTCELADDKNFFAWARERWPDERYRVQLDPWQDGSAGRA